MEAVAALLIVVGSLAVILVGLTWLARRVRRSGVGARLMGPIDEIYNPGAHRARHEIQVQDERMEARASADDRLRRD
ncbi:hypothetical protein O7606_18660 [Micromonospora sp. WMMD882]|uniref:hypothetical protein n=1 Tax=Micromonospora sp. WMMD882 TaxID=3015151 RepID=UPI00248CC794|nr:hypothetical protein [Micromonospora sp. WMMD882]WBB78248.1 hypothetical protein O7606_18660 [Micromonospora sp. WMMD882]